MTTATSSERPRILVVDDQPANIQTLYQVLKGDYDVAMATDGSQAIALCQRRPPDLVLLDVVMPGIDGFEVCKRLKADSATRDVPVIFVTARDSTEDETQGLEVGAVDFITKPVNPPVVRARVRTHVELKRQADFLRSMAFNDGLTGVANRRWFDERLQVEWLRCRRNKLPLSLILLDLDHFKAYNDHYGHQAGDDCLRAVAAAMKARLGRPADLLARYGGEEFVCLLPETPAEGARAKSEDLGRAVFDLGIPHAGSATAPVVTISRGVATAAPAVEGSPSELLARADERLYAAKHAGRNRSEG
ncbi:MAG: diguanylate cyclase [Xanthomonadales bacterium]|nr:Response regulator PleD [Xanthomonadales bacterium]MCC6591895.1 diguanylate cyclase [Xanthomonadales bacterium]MCE7932664.1 diguanylate cyclase [Xanthomonadales bacterium PRO6]